MEQSFFSVSRPAYLIHPYRVCPIPENDFHVHVEITAICSSLGLDIHSDVIETTPLAIRVQAHIFVELVLRAADCIPCIKPCSCTLLHFAYRNARQFEGPLKGKQSFFLLRRQGEGADSEDADEQGVSCRNKLQNPGLCAQSSRRCGIVRACRNFFPWRPLQSVRHEKAPETESPGPLPLLVAVKTKRETAVFYSMAMSCWPMACRPFTILARMAT